MITDNGKAYIARNFGVNNCYAMDEIVPCTVYTDGTPNVRTLDTSTILFVLVTEVADKVKTAAGTFTLANLIAANDGSYISMMDALEIEAYCITGAPPVTPPVTPPYTPPVTPPYTPPVTPPVTPPPTGAKDYEIINPTVNCDSYNCYVKLNIKNCTNTSSSIYMRVDVDGSPKFKRHLYLLRGATKAQSLALPFTGINDGYHNLTIAVGKVVDTDTYTHRFLVGAAGIEPPVTPPYTPPAAASLSAAEFIAEIRRRGTLDLARISMIPANNKWFRFAGQLVYRMAGGKGGIVITSPGKSNMYAAFSKDERTVTRVEKNWAMARIAELPFKAPTTPPVTPPYTPPVTPPPTTGVPEAIKRWVAVNYGDGTRVTSASANNLLRAMVAGTLAPLPAGYTKADITEDVRKWARDNVGYIVVVGICGWIEHERSETLTEKHAMYIYSLSIGWSDTASEIFGEITPRPERIPTELATEDNALAVYSYSIGWYDTGNELSGCNIKR